MLEGALAHKDSLGTGSVLHYGDVQRMSAGTGVRHSEFNGSRDQGLHFLQIWILPEKDGLAPGYEEKHFAPADKQGRLRLIASRDARDGSVTIHQDAAIFAGIFAKGEAGRHALAPGRHAPVTSEKARPRRPCASVSHQTCPERVPLRLSSAACLVAACFVAAVASGAAAGALRPAGPRSDELARGYLHSSWQTEGGLPDNTVTALLQTRDGYLWVGSQFGLARFDGVAFSAFDQRNVGALGSNYVSSLAESPAGVLWAGTRRGLTRLEGGVWTRFALPDGLPAERVNALRFGRDGALWAATGAGVARFDGARFALAGGLDAPTDALEETPAGEIWAGGPRGLFRLSDGRFAPVALPPEGGARAAVKALHATADGAVWVGTGAGLFRLEAGRTTTLRERDGLPSDDVIALAEDRSGRVWASTTAGLVSFAPRSTAPEVVTHWDGLDGVPPVLALHEDREGSLWLGTTGGGLHRLRSPLFTTFDRRDGLPAEEFWSVVPLADGSVWAGSTRGPLHLHGGEVTAFLEVDGKPAGDCLALVHGADGRVWFRTDHGLARIERGRAVLVGGREGLPAGNVRGLFEDRQGALWLGSNDGLHRWKDGVLETWRLSTVPAANVPRVITEDKKGRIWAGAQAGLHLLEGGKLTTFTTRDGLSSDDVTTLFADGDDLWVGSVASGLSVVHQGRVLPVPLRERVWVDGVLGIVPDSAGNFWMASGQGLLRAPRQQLLEAALGSKLSLDLRVYDKRDGLRTAEFNGSGAGSAAAGPDGRLWFASSRGLVNLDPRHLPQNPAPPPVVIERLLVDGQEAQPGQPASFPPGSGSVELRYTALSLRVPDRVRFRYRLEGLGTDWVDAGSRRAALFPSLPAGRYRFQVIASNDEGVWNQAGAAVAFELRPRFRETPLFAALGAASLALLITGAFRLRSLSARRRERELQSLVQVRTAELSETRAQLERRVEERTAQLAGELAERKRLEEQLLQAQKLDSIGRLAGGLAHDLNNVLTAIIGYADLLGNSVTDPEARSDALEIVAAGNRAATLIRQLLAFARKQQIEPKVLSVNDLLLNLDRMLQRLITPSVKMELLPRAAPGWVRADPSQLEQVLINLVVNARDAMPTGGSMLVETHEVALQAPPPHLAGLTPGAWVVISVTDTGTGLSDEAKRHLFEPFFTTKALGKGTGLGLATCYGIVQQAGGQIGVRSQPGQGCTFEVWLPRVGERAGPKVASDPKLRTGGHELVLLVEDDPQVRALALRVLRDAGYIVLEAADGLDGLEVARRHGGPLDVLLTDVLMPRMGGPELAGKLRALQPDLRVLYTSGYAEGAIPDGEATGFLRKPFSAPELLARLRAALDG